MIKEILICLALFDMSGIVNEKNICNNIETLSYISNEYKIDTYTYVSMLWIESNFNKEIISYTGKACGISQVVPKWTRPRKTCKDLNSDVKLAMIQGAKIFRGFKVYGGKSLDISLCGYNQGYRCKGEIEVKEGGYDYRKEGLEYAEKVKSFRNKLKSSVRKQKRKLRIYKEKLKRAFSFLYEL
tara:strand:+ start:318 stop:869 length:552 start_codon:yes stop_codon:yes gene_type:complete